jgi:hypothetical protein
MPDRVVRLGIDYGTSFSKIVFRDYGAPGGDKAFVAMRNGEFRIRSTVGVRANDFIFGADPRLQGRDGNTVWHESVKMRVAGDLKGDLAHYFHGPAHVLPDGFSSRDLAALTVLFLISEGKRAIREHLKHFSGSVVVGFSLGMPMSFYDDPLLKSTFLEVAQAAWEISKAISVSETLSFREARRLLNFAYDEIAPLAANETRDWVRTEAEAALWWPFQSPAVSDGPYAQIDIGAGTTNVSIFRIVPKHGDSGWMKESLSFFGATSPPVGMDAVDSALGSWRQIEDHLALRGREAQLLRGGSAHRIIDDIVRQLREAYRSTIERAFVTHLQSPFERERWRRHKVFFLGGGSAVHALVDPLRVSPIQGNEKTIHEIALHDTPADILMSDQSAVPFKVLPHVAVAYGLSNIAAEIPKAESPGEVPPMEALDLSSRRFQPLPDRDDWRY